MSPTHRREEGVVIITVAILLVVFMAAVALTVDVGGLYLRRREQHLLGALVRVSSHVDLLEISSNLTLSQES